MHIKILCNCMYAFRGERVTHMFPGYALYTHGQFCIVLLIFFICHELQNKQTDTQWIQARLPICNGGLGGIRRDTSLALSAFRAAAASISYLQNAFLASCGFALIDTLRLPCWSGVPLIVFPALKEVMIKSSKLGLVSLLPGVLIWSRNRLPPLSIRFDFWNSRVLTVATSHMLYLSIRAASTSIIRQ